jgi:hypothetical protein
VHVRRIQAGVLSLSLLLAAVAMLPVTVAAAACGSGSTALGNGGFEDPGVGPDSYAQLDASLVSPWNTTDVVNQIEIWGDTFLGVPAWEGSSFAELNANSVGTLYQDVVTTPGSTMDWTLHHRGRDGTDVMRVLIGDAVTADVWSDAGWDAVSPDIADDHTAWGTATGSYVVPTDQTCTRFAFRAVSSVGGESYGNLIDGITFSIPVDATPTPTPDATATPTGSVAPAVATKTPRPRYTIPPTDVAAALEPGSSGAGETAALLVGWAAALAGVGLLTARRAGQRRDR